MQSILYIDRPHQKENFKIFLSNFMYRMCMVYKYIDIVGTSEIDINNAIKNAFEEASKTVKNIKWGEMGRVTFKVNDNQKIEFQAEVRIGFKIERDNNDK